MILGIRGEDINTRSRVMDINDENHLHAVITDTEVMGNENNLYFSFGGTQAVARVSKYEVSQIGDKVDFVFMPQRCISLTGRRGSTTRNCSRSLQQPEQELL